MTKLELTVSTDSLHCETYDQHTARVLGLPLLTSGQEQQTQVKVLDLLADEHERERFQSAVDKLTTHQQNAPSSNSSPFETLNLVFRAPNATTEALPADRSPLSGVFSSPMTAIHTSDDLHLSCFTHIHYDSSENLFRISALEYSRNHRCKLLRQEFASWLIEEKIEKSVIATKTDGTVVFWNRFATSLYQYDQEEALGQEIRHLISSNLSLEQGNEMMRRMALGEHFTTMYLCRRRDNHEFMVHTTTTPILDQNRDVQFIVGVSADYSQLHKLVKKLENLNTNLEKEVIARTEQLLAREKYLRMIGAAMKESDTGVLITDDDYKVTWCNDAVSRMLGLKKGVILGMCPWDLPLQQEQKQDTSLDGSHENVLDRDDQSSSLESYFLEEKAFHENKGETENANKGEADLTVATDEASEDEGSNNNEDDLSTATLGLPKRPPMAAICYRIESPSMPIHIMVSVEAMPPHKPPRVHRTASSAARREQMRGALDLSMMTVESFIPIVPPATNLEPQDNDSSQEVKDEITSTTAESEQSEQKPLFAKKRRPSLKPPSLQFMITLRDITADRKAEEAQLTAERASAANEAKTQMMQMLSHELRTPLQGIMGVASTSMMDIEENDSVPNAAVNTNDGGVKGTMYDSLSTILASSRLLLTLINNTLDTRKINADMMQKIELSTVSMMACIRDSFQYCGPFAAINEAMLELADSDGGKVKLPHILNTSSSNSTLMSGILKRKHNVTGNRLRLEQVIVNLLSNGIKYTTPGTAVVASVRNSTLAQVLEEMKAAPSSSLKFLSEDDLNELEGSSGTNGGEVCIFSVRDHGKGIPPEEYGKVFGEFQQLNVSAEKDNNYEGGGSGQSSGSGLGLNLSMKFVTLMRGHIWFQNCTDGCGGATFSFYLHRCRSPRESVLNLTEGDVTTRKRGSLMNESSRSDSNSEQELHEDKMSRVRVLVIDDSMINIKVLARMLAKLKVQHCKTALSGAAALEYLEPIRNDPTLVPNLILCDLQMPGMDGYELMGHLREMNICSSPIIMACSADWGSETEGKCHEVGFDGLLRKPITVTYLKEFITNTKLN